VLSDPGEEDCAGESPGVLPLLPGTLGHLESVRPEDASVSL
jgi:hypothetical protein